MVAEENIKWVYYLTGMALGATVGFLFGLVVYYGRAWFIRFVLKKTPIEPVIIGTGKISIPVKGINDGRFEHDGLPYVVPSGRTVPKSLIAGSVSAVYFEGIPDPVEITPNSMNFKLTDNTILSPSMRSILHNDALKKMFSREKITHTVLFVMLVMNVLVGAAIMSYEVKNTKALNGVVGRVEANLNSFRGSLNDAVTQLRGYMQGMTVAQQQQQAPQQNPSPNSPQAPQVPPGG